MRTILEGNLPISLYHPELYITELQDLNNEYDTEEKVVIEWEVEIDNGTDYFSVSTVIGSCILVLSVLQWADNGDDIVIFEDREFDLSDFTFKEELNFDEYYTLAIEGCEIDFEKKEITFL